MSIQTAHKQRETRRGEIEEQIVLGLRDLHSREEELRERYSGLREARPEAQIVFLLVLSQLEKKASRLENLLHRLELQGDRLNVGVA